MELNNLFTNSSVTSSRIIYTPSAFARSSLIHLQETGKLTAIQAHKSERSGMASCLFFTVLSGSGVLAYDGKEYKLYSGDCVFIDCKKPYSHETASDLWFLQWCHFYGPNMNAIYRKYQERGGQPVFRLSTDRLSAYRVILEQLYSTASGNDHVRDMKLHGCLSELLTLLMEDAYQPPPIHTDTGSDGSSVGEPSFRDPRRVSTDSLVQSVKEYLDANYLQRITLDELGSKFYINKHYLMKLFKERYGVTVTAYLNQVKVTYIKQQLRFTDKTVEEISGELSVEPTYLSRMFKKIEKMSPSEYRKVWWGKK